MYVLEITVRYPLVVISKVTAKPEYIVKQEITRTLDNSKVSIGAREE